VEGHLWEEEFNIFIFFHMESQLEVQRKRYEGTWGLSPGTLGERSGNPESRTPSARRASHRETVQPTNHEYNHK